MNGDLPSLAVPAIGATDRLVELPPIFLRDVRSGAVPRLPTSVRVGLRGTVLCTRFDGRDDHIVATHTKRDDPLWEEDVFEVFLAAVEPPHLYYELEVNPLGALFDARVESPELCRRSMQVDAAWEWDGLQARVTRRARRWSATLRIPLAAVFGEPAPARLRANFCRVDRGDPDEYTAWSPTFADPPDFHVPERFGALSLPRFPAP